MNIPVEHFTATPVYALSPSQETGGKQKQSLNYGNRLPLFKLGVPTLPGQFLGVPALPGQFLGVPALPGQFLGVPALPGQFLHYQDSS